MGVFGRKRRGSGLGGKVRIPQFDIAHHTSRTVVVRRSRKAMVLGFAALMIYLVALSQMGLYDTYELWQLRGELTQEKHELTAEVVDLDTRRRLLLTDSLYIEMVARTQYHLSRPDEIIYEIEDGSP